MNSHSDETVDHCVQLAPVYELASEGGEEKKKEEEEEKDVMTSKNLTTLTWQVVKNTKKMTEK